MVYIPDEIGLHIMLYCSKYDIVKLMRAVGYSTLHMDEVFATINKYRPPVITTLKWRGLTIVAHDDYIVDVKCSKYACAPHEFEYYNIVSECPEGHLIPDKYTMSCDWYTLHIDMERFCYFNCLEHDEIANRYKHSTITGLYYPTGIYLADNNSLHCGETYVEEYDENGQVVIVQCAAPRYTPHIYEYHDILFCLVILAKRGYWMKQTYNQCYKGGDYDHWFWDNMDEMDPECSHRIHYHAIGNKIVDFKVYYYKECEVAARSEIYDEELFHTKWHRDDDLCKLWKEKYNFGLRPVYPKDTDDLSLQYRDVDASLTQPLAAGYHC